MCTFKRNVGSLCFLLTFMGLVLLASPISFAAEGGSTLGSAVGIQVGNVWPTGEIGKDVDNAISPGIFYEYQASDTFGLHTSWVRARHSQGALAVDSYNVDIKANLIYYDKLSPYVLFGMGLYSVSKDYNSSSLQTGSKTLFGVDFGMGADLELSSSIFVGMQFVVHNLFAGTATLPSGNTKELSGRWSGLFFRGGFRF